MNNFVSYNVESPPERDFPFHQFNLSVIFDPGCSWLLLRIHPRSSSSSLNNARSVLDGSYLRQLVLSWPLLSLWHGSSSTPGTLLLVICLFSLQWNKVTRTHFAEWEWLSQCSAIFGKRRQLCAPHLFCYCFSLATWWRCSKEVLRACVE